MIGKSVVFIGGGNMAEGIIRGQIANKVMVPESIHVYDVLEERMRHLHDTYGVSPVNDVAVAMAEAELIFVAVRPQDADVVMERIRAHGNADALIVSICAGLTLDRMAERMGAERRIARVMPNVLIEARHGYSGVCINDKINAKDKEDIAAMMGALGQTMFIPERLFDEFTAYGCAGPAYVLHFLTGMIDAGVQSGFSRADSAAIAIENMIGSAVMLQRTGKHPYQIIDAMTSPAGVTIDGIHVLAESGIHGVVMSCVKSAVERARELS
jgi:pyrroline-5-carboxylate reductase